MQLLKHAVIPTKQWPRFITAQDGLSTSAGQWLWKYQVFGCFVTNCPGLKQNILRCQSKESWFFFSVLKWVANACNLLHSQSCWGQLIRERTSQPRGTINTDPSTCSPEPTVGIISKPVPEHHKVQAGLEAEKRIRLDNWGSGLRRPAGWEKKGRIQTRDGIQYLN